MAIALEATAWSDTNDSFMLMRTKRESSRECVLSGVVRRSEGADEHQHLDLSVPGGNDPFYSITLDTVGLDFTAMIKLASADAGYSRAVSLATEEAYPPFRENGARDSHAMPLFSGYREASPRLHRRPMPRAYTPSSALSTPVQVRLVLGDASALCPTC